MLRSLIAFCLSRRLLVMVAFAAFLGLGYVAFLTLNIEAYPDPAPPIIEIIAQQAGPVAGGSRALHHDPDRDRGRQHAGPEVHPLQHRLRARLHPPAVRIRPRLSFRAPADPQPAEGCGAAGRRAAGDLARRRHQRDLPLRAGRAAGHGRDAAQDAAGLGGRAQAAHRARRRRRRGARRQDQGIPGRDQSRPHDGLRADAAADHDRDLGEQFQCRRPHHLDRRTVGQCPQHRRHHLDGRYRQHRADPAGRRAGAGVRRRQGPDRLRAAARPRRPRRQDRRRHRHRADAEARTHHGRGQARARGGRDASTPTDRCRPASRSCRSTIAATSSRSRCRPCCTICCSVSR